MASTDPRADPFVEVRPLLFSIAYQMTGSVGDAEDIVSECYLRWRRALGDGREIRNFKQYLASTATRLSIDHLRSARTRRESYAGTWLPEPLVDETAVVAFERVELADTLSMAFLVLLESLSPTERAVFVLREVFEFGYPEISGIVDRSEANCRQLLRRARKQVEARKPRFDIDARQREELATRFFSALEVGDLEPLVDLLAADVVAYGDGGGDGPSLPRPVNGPEKVRRLLHALAGAIGSFGLLLERTTVNGQPGALVRSADGLLLNVLSLDIREGCVQAVRSVVNPDKLQHLGPLIDAEHPLRGGGRDRSTGR